MDFRHEWKHEINALDLLALRARLRAVMATDPHAPGGSYMIRSLYFDTPEDRALHEKLDGVNGREKFRLRCYNSDFSLIRLEKKCKYQGLCRKETALLTLAETQALLAGEWGWMRRRGRPIVLELYSKMCTQGLLPKTIVEYVREPFVYAPGNVRVTLDRDIRTGLRSTDFLNTGGITVPVGGPEAILEVKWDAFLPAVVRDAVQLRGRRTAAFSKYAASRIYG